LDKDGKTLLKDPKTGALTPVAAIKTQDRAVTDDDLNKDKNKDGEGALRLAALTSLGLGTGDPYPAFQTDKDGKLSKDKDGKLMVQDFTVSYKPSDAVTGSGTAKDPTTFNFHTTPGSVISPHSFNYVFIQACIAILILVGFESVTAMGEEAKNPKKDIPRAVLLALIIQGAFCYLIEYFCANYMLHNGYGLTNASSSGAPIGDMMQIAGAWAFGSAKAGRAFMLVQAFTVFLALIGTTLSCLSTGARVTYAMGRDEEMGAHFGMLHEKNLSPHKAIWTLCVISIVIGIVTVVTYLASSTASLAPLDKHNFWYSFGIFSPTAYTWLPNTFVIVSLVSNFGTFLLYMLTCVVAIVAFREHHTFNTVKHTLIPIFGVLANLGCMLFYLVGSFTVPGMSWHEPYIALGVCAVWGIWGVIYLTARSKSKGKEVFLTQKPATST
jgi:APA family basic amino acid/polyamine antiporter